MTKSIWSTKPNLSVLAKFSENTLVQHLNIVFTEVGDDYLVATMPVNDNSRQPHGVLHGGASVALAETLGSTAAGLVVDLSKQFPVGLEINANHIKSVPAGMVTGTARALHLGTTTQVWEIKICNEKQQLACISRLTVAILDRQ